jgi:hypothetical protein
VVQAGLVEAPQAVTAAKVALLNLDN